MFITSNHEKNVLAHFKIYLSVSIVAASGLLVGCGENRENTGNDVPQTSETPAPAGEATNPDASKTNSDKSSGMSLIERFKQLSSTNIQSGRVANNEPGESAANSVIETPATTEFHSVNEALSYARTLLMSQQTAPDEVLDAMQPFINEIPELSISTDSEQVNWNRLVLNAAQRPFDVFRFSSPLEGPADMHWVFVLPKRTAHWYILSARGQILQGLSNHKKIQNMKLTDVELPEMNTTFLQRFSNGQIKPKQQYLLWFESNGLDPVESHIAINLAAAGTRQSKNTSESIARTIGLKIPGYQIRPQGTILQNLYSPVGAIEYVPERHWMAVGTGSGSVDFWDASTRKQLYSFNDLTGSIEAMAISTDGQLVAFAGPRKKSKVVIMNIKPPINAATLEVEFDDVIDMKFSKDNTSLAIASGSRSYQSVSTKQISIWNTRTWEATNRIPLDRNSDLRFVGFVADSNVLVAVGRQSRKEAAKTGIVFLDAQTGDVNDFIPIEAFKSIAGEISADGTRLVVFDNSGNLKVWDLKTKAEISVGKMDARIRGAVFTHDGENIALGLDDKTVRLWDVADRNVRKTWHGHQDAVVALALTPNGDHLFTGSHDGTLRFWKVPLQSGATRQRPSPTNTGVKLELTQSPTRNRSNRLNRSPKPKTSPSVATNIAKARRDQQVKNSKANQATIGSGKVRISGDANNQPSPKIPQLERLHASTGMWKGSILANNGLGAPVLSSTKWVMNGRFLYSANRVQLGPLSSDRFGLFTYLPESGVYRRLFFDRPMIGPFRLRVRDYRGDWDEDAGMLVLSAVFPLTNTSSTFTLGPFKDREFHSKTVFQDARGKILESYKVTMKQSSTRGSLMALPGPATVPTELGVLKPLAGDWKGSVVDAQGKEQPMTLSYKWVMGGLALLGQYQIGEKDPIFGISVTTFDPENQNYPRWNFQESSEQKDGLEYGNYTGTWDESTRSLTFVDYDEISAATTTLKFTTLDDGHMEWTRTVHDEADEIVSEVHGSATRP